MKNELTAKESAALIATLKERFEKNTKRHKGMEWSAVETKLKKSKKLWSLQEMESTGGEPDVVAYDKKTDEYIFMDCTAETPSGRRSVCYDRAAWDARKENKPNNNAMDMAKDMGIEILNEEEYRYLQQLGPFDMKTSSWLKTPDHIRKLDGAIFGDYRFKTVFIYHNGVQSYYAARGFRGLLRV